MPVQALAAPWLHRYERVNPSLHVYSEKSSVVTTTSTVRSQLVADSSGKELVLDAAGLGQRVPREQHMCIWQTSIKH